MSDGTKLAITVICGAVRRRRWSPGARPVQRRPDDSVANCHLVDEQQAGNDRGADQQELQMDADRPAHEQHLRADHQRRTAMSRWRKNTPKAKKMP